MTAATVDAATRLDTTVLDLDLEHPTATALAATLAGYPPPVRRRLAAQAVDARRLDLGLYRALYLERYGHALDPATVEAADDLLIELTLLAIA